MIFTDSNVEKLKTGSKFFEGVLSMGADLMSIAYASGAMQQAQTLNAIQTQVLSNAMDTQTQNAQALLQMVGTSATASHPFLGKNVDFFV